ncbi:sulfotransferase domain-containing protein [uncultured Halovibrio sp.]|uniref:sulfotransferase domain-containing protein n=1 Tax=uncultured Halovibrio sp. TaxID=985049 RepID=UPI0025DA6910|nr:sulfotransferase domain-containing protein [uncultured Halovibrio sp.]
MRILIASFPRAGSTMLFRAIAGLPQKSWTPKNPVCEFVRDLSDLPDKPFLKTHSPAPQSLPDDVRVIYLYGDPIDSIVSSTKKRWDTNSWRMNNWFQDYEPDLYNSDDFQLKNNFESWMSPQDYPVLAIRYESLWENHEKIVKFIGYNFALPEKRNRNTEIEENLKNHLKETYKELIKRVKEAPDTALIQKEKINNPKTEQVPTPDERTNLNFRICRIYARIHEKLIRKIKKIGNY